VGGLIALIFFLFMALAYFLPSLVAASRKSSNLTATLLINILLGWTGIGWIASMIMACTGTSNDTYGVGPGFMPYGMNPYQQNPYAQNPYAQNPYGQNPYQQNPYTQNPYANPYQQNPYQQPYGFPAQPAPLPGQFGASQFAPWSPNALTPGYEPGGDPGQFPLPAHAPPTSAPANWYPDPTEKARLRFYDGANWTEHTSN
jgi:uncharacterized membrane protein YqaE (UPF0057 family)